MSFTLTSGFFLSVISALITFSWVLFLCSSLTLTEEWKKTSILFGVYICHSKLILELRIFLIF